MKAQEMRTYWTMAALVIGVAAGFRFFGLATSSLTLDESTMVEFARGVMARGYPYIYVGSMEVPLSTYELVPYFIAGSASLFGFTDFAVRTPSALFGTLTAFMVFAIGWRWFDRRVALLGGLLYAISPWSIHWSQNCFHPAQTQFFVLLTVYQTHRILSQEKAKAADCYLAALFFTLSYLSWEGTGFVLPILLLVAVFMRWGQWEWLKNKHLWIAASIVIGVVLLQGVRRVLLQVNYLMVGSGKSDMSLPQLAFTKTNYSPSFYIDTVFGIESHVVLGGIFVLGLFLLRRNWNLRFVYLFVLLAIAFMTNFLAYYNAHYIYYVLPMFILSVAGATVIGLDGLVRAFRNAEIVESGSRALRAAIVTIVLGVLSLEFATASAYGLKPYRMREDFINPKRGDTRPDLAGIDYRGLADQLAMQYRPGDTVIALAPLALRFYTGIRGDYFLQTVTGRKVVFDPNQPKSVYVDKYVGNPVLRSRAEFEAVLSRSSRVWLWCAPYFGFTDVVDRETRDSIERRFRLVTETYDGKLYLWEQ